MFVRRKDGLGWGWRRSSAVPSPQIQTSFALKLAAWLYLGADSAKVTSSSLLSLLFQGKEGGGEASGQPGSLRAEPTPGPC